MKDDAIAPEFSRLVAVDRVGPRGAEVEIAAEPGERAALARRFGLLGLDSLTARLRLEPMAGALWRLRGHLEAEVVQACVVTLEPVPARVAEDFTLIYGDAPEEEWQPGTEVVLTMDEEEPPEPIRHGKIDIGEAVAEHLALALEPFPRAPGARVEDVIPGEEGIAVGEAKENPFAKLAALKGKKR